MTASSPIELRSSPSHPTSGAPAAQGESDPTGETPHDVDPAARPAYSIRMADTAGACHRCGEATGTGPVGYHGDQAICDLCLLEGSNELGMVLALVAVTRACASVELTSDADRRAADAELGAFARIYESFAAKSGPARRILPRLTVH